MIWFIFTKDGELWIGSMTEVDWRFESSELNKDGFDAVYQEALDEYDDIRMTKLKERDAFIRDKNIALKRMELSGFSCEYDPEHSLFISRFSSKPYLESHHLIPITLQGHFDVSLDTVDNVFCLCPCCHRAVHHAENTIARDILSKLAASRPVLDNFSLTTTDLFCLYAVEEIN